MARAASAEAGEEMSAELDLSASTWPLRFKLSNGSLKGSSKMKWRLVARVEAKGSLLDGAWGSRPFDLERGLTGGLYGGLTRGVDLAIDERAVPRNAPGRVGPVPIEDIAEALRQPPRALAVGVIALPPFPSRVGCNGSASWPAPHVVDPLDERQLLTSRGDEDEESLILRPPPLPPLSVSNSLDYIAVFNDAGTLEELADPSEWGDWESQHIPGAAFLCESAHRVAIFVLSPGAGASALVFREEHGHWRKVDATSLYVE